MTGVDAGRSSRAVAGDLLALLGGIAAAVYVTAGEAARRTMTTATYTFTAYTTCAVAAARRLPGRAPAGGRCRATTRAPGGCCSCSPCARSSRPHAAQPRAGRGRRDDGRLAILLETPGAALVAWVWLGSAAPGAHPARGGAGAGGHRPGRREPPRPGTGSAAGAGRVARDPSRAQGHGGAVVTGRGVGGYRPGMTSDRPVRLRRSTLAVPGSSPKMLDKARGLPADEVFLDLEDAVAPIAKAEARAQRRGRAQRGRLRGQGPLRAGQRLDHAVDLRRRHRGRRGRRRQPRRDHAAEGPDGRAGRRPRPAADPARAVLRVRRRPDRHRGADRERPRAWSTSTRSPPAPAWRRSSSGRPTSWRRSR